MDSNMLNLSTDKIDTNIRKESMKNYKGALQSTRSMKRNAIQRVSKFKNNETLSFDYMIEPNTLLILNDDDYFFTDAISDGAVRQISKLSIILITFTRNNK